MAHVKPSASIEEDLEEDPVRVKDKEGTSSSMDKQTKEEFQSVPESDIINIHPLSEESIIHVSEFPSTSATIHDSIFPSTSATIHDSNFLSTSAGNNSCDRSYLELLASESVEIIDDDDNEIQTAIENSLTDQTEQVLQEGKIVFFLWEAARDLAMQRWKRCLAPCMFDFILFGEDRCHPLIDDVQDHEIKRGHCYASEDETTFALYKLDIMASQNIRKRKSFSANSAISLRLTK